MWCSLFPALASVSQPESHAYSYPACIGRLQVVNLEPSQMASELQSIVFLPWLNEIFFSFFFFFSKFLIFILVTVLFLGKRIFHAACVDHKVYFCAFPIRFIFNSVMYHSPLRRSFLRLSLVFLMVMGFPFFPILDSPSPNLFPYSNLHLLSGGLISVKVLCLSFYPTHE